MKSLLSTLIGRSKLRVGVFAAVALLATNSTVNVLSVHAQVTAQNNEIQKILSNLDKEAKRRTEATAKAKQAVQSTETIAGDTKTQVLKSLDEVQAANDAAVNQAKGVKDLAGAQQLAKSFDQQYDKYATSQAKGTLLKDSDQQQQVQQQLDATAKDIQSKLNSNKAAGQDTSGQQLQLDNIIKLIVSIAAIVASVVALIAALAAGDYAQASVIFLAIVGQLAQNLASILNVQSSLQVMIGGLGG